MNAPSVPVGRLAPSPTGFLHLGHARSFLLAWWHTRSRGGRVVLRIEDLDPSRCRPEFVDALMRDLEWLGLDWDAAPILQSQAPEASAAALAHLLESGAAYPCVCSRREIAESAPHSGEQLRYPGTCRDRYPDLAAAAADSGRPVGVRFRVPTGPVHFEDALLGPQALDVAADVGDFTIARRDGAFAYQLAVVCDDARDGVTEVLRGEDLLSSTPRQELLQRALGLPTPTWIHVPLVVDAQGRRHAKRDGDLSLSQLRDAGVDPRAVVSWVARSAGFEVPTRVEATEVLPQFELPRLSRSPAVAPPDLAHQLSRTHR